MVFFLEKKSVCKFHRKNILAQRSQKKIRPGSFNEAFIKFEEKLPIFLCKRII